MSSLLKLSNELLDQVFEDCDIKSIKCCRLAHRTLREAADRHLLRELPLYYNQNSLDRLDYLGTSHQHVAKGIKGVWLQLDRLGRLPTFESWKERCTKQSGDRFAILSKDWKSLLDQDWDSELQKHRLYKHSTLATSGLLPPDEWVRRVSSTLYLWRCYCRYTELYNHQSKLDRSIAWREKSAALFRACPYLKSVWITAGDIVRPTSTHLSATFRQGKSTRIFTTAQG